MLYEIGNGMKDISVKQGDPRNNLQIGTILHLNGYNCPNYVIVKNLGVDKDWSAHGATYLTVSLDDLGQSRHQAYELEYLKDKRDDRIQLYITDKVKTLDEVLDLWEKSEEKRKRMADNQKKLEDTNNELEAKGRELFKKYIPATAQALIIACYDTDDSDVQIDYFSHNSSGTVILGFSLQKRDLFSEMRKYTCKIPETSHLAVGYGHFEPRVMIGADFKVDGSYYHKGAYSHWHRELTEEHGKQRVFKTRAEAEAYTIKAGEPCSIAFEGNLIPFYWNIQEEGVEHREKWSMGDGYYLKDGYRHDTGWRIEKIRKYKGDWDRDLYISLAKRCVFEK